MKLIRRKGAVSYGSISPYETAPYFADMSVFPRTAEHMTAAMPTPVKMRKIRLFAAAKLAA